jgi:hypothetical protein
LFTHDTVVWARSGQQEPLQKTLPDGQEEHVPATQLCPVLQQVVDS